MSTDPLSELMLRLGAQDRSALRDVYDAAAGTVFAVCLRILNDREAAGEALQEIFTRVWRRARLYDPARGPALDWVVAIAREHALERRRARALSEAEIAATPPWEPPRDPDRAEGNIARLPPMAARTGLEPCLAQLDPDRAAALRGAYLAGLSQEELAARHRIPPETLRAWLQRSLAGLRTCVGP